jgi:hypothetical protein
MAKNESPKSSIWRLVKRFFRKKWFNFITTVVLILTLWAYLVANDINRAAMMAAHTPWIKFQSFKFSPAANEGIQVKYHVINKSDTPAFDITLQMFVDNVEVVSNAHPAKKFEVPPGDDVEGYAIFQPYYRAEDACKEINEGLHSIALIATYHDLFKRTLIHHETFRMNQDGTRDTIDVQTDIQ